ncbi:MAG: RNase adapter RapZ [Desulfobacterales bacterium]|nr:MAG: RNase adapter RapZ [Desulfobacterales bacterium]
MKHLRIIILTGLSGSGKSIAIAALEDAGFYCVDNMPVALLPKFLDLPIESDFEIAGVAFVMDLREKGFLANSKAVFEALKQKGYCFEIIFLEAEEKILLQRFNATRRQHPLSQGQGLVAGIRAEREQLAELKAAADEVIDTSEYTVHELKAQILDIAHKSKKLVSMRITIVSFGFKYGIPLDADLIIDVRFLANPYFIPELKALDGESPEVKDYILNQAQTRTFLAKYLELLDYLIPLYAKEGKAYLTLAVGCTGGRHRSVTIARSIFEHINQPERKVAIIHRDIEQPL